MKIKHWLMISYFIVMLLPIAALYVIYVSINHLDQKQSFVDYIETSSTITAIEKHLQDASLYQIQPLENYDHLKKLTDETIYIRLFRADGARLYSTTGETSLYTFEDRDRLYKQLNELKMNYRTFTWKSPVFENDELVGIYEIGVSRDNWVQGVNKRTTISFIFFGIFFILTYIGVLILLHRKFNQPLRMLQNRMTKFAKDEPLEKVSYRAKDEIGTLLNHFEEMRLQIEEARLEVAKQQEEKDFIVASLSHDLKTPLTVVQAYSEALLKDDTLSDKEKREYETILFNKLDYMKNMLDDLVTFNALQNAKINEKLVQVDGEEFFEMLFSGYGESAKQNNIRLTVEQTVASTYSVYVKQLMRVIDNFMSNALRHTDEGGHIWMGAFSSNKPLPKWVFPVFYEKLNTWRNNNTLIIIQNDGKNIPKDELDTIFDPFVQGERARNSGGSGLGLSIAKKIIELHGGKIRILSEKGFGTVVACLLKEENE